MIDFLDYEKKFCKREGIETKDFWKNNKLRKKCWEEYDLLSEAAAKKIAKEFINQTGEGYVYYFTYADEGGGIFSDLEHENNWGGLPTIQVSHH